MFLCQPLVEALVSRRIEDIDGFLKVSIWNDLPDPFAIPLLEQAAARVLSAIQNRERITGLWRLRPRQVGILRIDQKSILRWRQRRQVTPNFVGDPISESCRIHVCNPKGRRPLDPLGNTPLSIADIEYKCVCKVIAQFQHTVAHLRPHSTDQTINKLAN
jgi:hypothetical protein